MAVADTHALAPTSMDVLATSLSEVAALARAAAETVRPSPLLQTGHDRPVVLVHGFLATPAVMHPLARRLASEGLGDLALVAYPSVGLGLEDIVDRIATAALPLARAHGQVDIVGHSLGAVASRAWIKLYGGSEHVRRFVSLGGPHAGTSLHRLVPPPLGQALKPGGDWVRRIGHGPEPVPTVVVRARLDHQVFPPTRARIPGVHEVVLRGQGHNGLLYAKAAHDVVVEALTADAPLAPF